MNISLEHLELIPKLLNEIKSLKLTQAMSSEKRWLNTRELSDYIGYSLDAINKMVKDDIFIDGIHYYKPSKKLLFDKEQVDNWIVGIKDDKHKQRVNIAVENILAGMK
ncbi:MAG: DNA-binding protein [Campylobacterota bacterium]